MPGTLFVVATPLGNLADLSPRALRTLASVAAVLCEDTRRTSRLLARHELTTPRISCHRFNERDRVEALLDRLRAGEDLALVADAGTPGVADPGAAVVREVRAAGLPVVPIPGPSAVATLLSASGLPADRYVFDGFLPHRAGERRRRLRELAGETRTLVLFETPHRIRETLQDIADLFGERQLVVGREMTKLHESILSGTAAELRENLAQDVRGELTLVIAGADSSSSKRTATVDQRIVETWARVLEHADGDRRSALREASRELGLGRAELSRRLDELGLSSKGRRRR